jgi:LPS export ABC transporter protein LptC/lipopolysaccharide transport protein LptA
MLKTPELEKNSPMHIEGLELKENKGMFTSWELSSEAADVYKDKGIILFDKVSTKIFSETDHNSYRINSSGKGTYFINDDRFVLNNDVVIRTSNGFVFTTDAVQYDSENKSLKTNRPVTARGMTSKNDVLSIEGTGLKGNIDSGDFSITKKVSTKVGEDLEIKSGFVSFNKDGNQAVFKKDIYAKRDNMDIRGDQLLATYDKDGSLQKLDVLGNVMLNMEGKNRGSRKALCDHAEISGKDSSVVLLGRPEFHAGEDIMTGEKITFYTDTDEVLVEKVRAEVSDQGVGGK